MKMMLMLICIAILMLILMYVLYAPNKNGKDKPPTLIDSIHFTLTKYDVYIQDTFGVIAYRNDSGWKVFDCNKALEQMYQLYLKK